MIGYGTVVTMSGSGAKMTDTELVVGEVILDGIPLSEKEIGIIRQERTRIRKHQELLTFQALCAHADLRYDGTYRGDDYYVCRSCGKSITE